MDTMKKLGKRGMFGLAGLAATKKGAVDKIARNGGLGLLGMALAKKRKKEGMMGNRPMGNRPMVEDIMGGAGMGAPDMVAEEAPAGAMMRKGGKVKKMAKGGSAASKRADGCATKGKTKGRFV